MAVNKRKILASAQKHLQKGALDKALRDYQAALDADPRDTNVRLKIGDIQLRKGQRDEAINAYLKVAEQFMRDGFDAKAVALYKQITKIDPKRHDIYVPLADLYQRLGLASEAMSALQTAADAFHRSGRKREALDLLRRMASLDPTNVTSRLKIAELLRQAELPAEALAEYEEAAKELERQGDWEQRVTVLERILEIEHAHAAALEGIATALIKHGQPQRAESFAKRLLEADPSRIESYETLAAVFRGLDRDDAAADVYRQLAELYRTRGDEDKAREILQRFVPSEPLDFSAPEGQEGELGGGGDPVLEDFGDEDLLDESGADASLGLDAPLETGGDAPEEALEPVPKPAAGEPSAEEEPLPEGEPEELLAEAVVYLRYRKPARAVASLRAVLAQDPDHLDALEKLGEAYEAAGDPERAVQSFVAAARRVAELGDGERLAALRARVETLDAAAAAELPAPRPRETAPEAEANAEGAPGAGASEEDDHGAVSGDEDIEIEIDAGDLHAGAGGASTEGPAAAARDGASAGGTSTSSAQIAEELEEANFYYEQGMLEEAEAIYRRVLRSAPSHPQALLRLGEISAARGQDPTGASGSLDDTALSASGAGTVERAAAPPVTPSERAGEDEPSVPDDTLADLSIDLDGADDLGLDEPAEAPSAAPSESGAVGGLSSRTLEDVGADTARTDDRPASAPAADAPSPVSEASESPFDLAAELSEALAEEERRGSTGPSGSEDDGFESVFREFKRGVRRQLGEGDGETHYDLGIAYREMGLLEDAIGEFRVALGTPSRRLDALQMLGLCALEVGRPQDAIGHFEQALSAPEVPGERETALRFDLGRAYEAAGDLDRALATYREVAGIDPNFVDVARRIAALESGGAAVGESESAETYETFDDLIADAEGEAAEPEYESFDDVIAEADEEDGGDESSGAGGSGDPDEDRTQPDPTPPRRRRKISFV